MARHKACALFVRLLFVIRARFLLPPNVAGALYFGIMNEEVAVVFQPSGRKVFVLPGTILLEAAARAGFIIETPCGGVGRCGKCVVRVAEGVCAATEEERALLGAERVAEGGRLACRARVTGDLIVEIPETSLFQTAQRILSYGSGETVECRPGVVKRFLDMSAPDREDAVSDVERICRELGPVDIGLSALRDMPQLLREADYRVTATVAEDRVLLLEPGDTTGQCVGMAFDIGTTTIVGTLVDLGTGKDLGVASTINPQTSFGDDVVSRIKRCRDEPDGLSRLHDSVLKAVNGLIAEAAAEAELEPRMICEVVFAGNTTMQEILCGINPMSLGEIPFVPAFRDPLRLAAGEMGLAVNSCADVHIFPQIGGFVGGDTVAGILAARMDDLAEPTVLVDVGTNGEIVLAHQGKLIATSVAAGPAFEGARIVNGMRAAAGAIEKVVIGDDVQINVIGNAPPAGLCGTGLIDAVAGLLRSGVLDVTGRILGPDEFPSDVAPAIAARIVGQDDKYDFVLVRAEESGTGEEIRLYQKDIRELQLANGAIRAGISILLGTEGLAPSDLGAVLLAGAFGNFIRRSSATRIGMLPQIAAERIRFVGNTASFGAKRALLSREERERAARLAKETCHVDLSLSPEFQMEFASAMLFPEKTDEIP